MTSKKKLKRDLKHWKGAALVSRELEKTWFDVAMKLSFELADIKAGSMATPEDDKRLEVEQLR